MSAARARAATAALLVLLATAVFAGGGSAGPAQALSGDAMPDFTATRTLSREHVDGNGNVIDKDGNPASAGTDYRVTVSADKTSQLRGRQTVRVSWSGARPTGGRVGDVHSSTAFAQQEYPVVILQCRGQDDPSLPVEQQVRPETCWTTGGEYRQASASATRAVWRSDRYASGADRLRVVPDPWPEGCPAVLADMAVHQVPFVAADGTVFDSCTKETSAPEMASTDTGRPEIAAPTSADGTGEISVEIRTNAENASLGCSAEVPCSLVVIPVVGLSCEGADAICRRDGAYAPGELFGNPSDPSGLTQAVTGQLWWSASNWDNRFVVPLDLAPAANVCDVLDDRAPQALSGSELLSQATLQWAPAYCLAADRFRFQHNRMGEPIAFRNMLSGLTSAAFVAAPQPAASGTPVGYAPTAVTGFGIGYLLDYADGGGEVTQLRLTPRLLVKLLTGSYPGVPLSGEQKTERPDLADNPTDLMADPEFTELNPGLPSKGSISMAALLALNQPSDLTQALTAYLAADPEAMAFLSGEPDPWGMSVNRYYGEASTEGDLSLPTNDWPLLDPWTAGFGGEVACPTTVRQTRIASPVSRLVTISESLQWAWPTQLTRCNRTTGSDSRYALARSDPQSYGSRAMLGLVTLADADRYGIRVASLRVSGTGADALFAGPTTVAMANAVSAATQSAPGQPFVIDPEELRSRAAYPGTMIVHTAARLSGLEPTVAANVAQFVRLATTEGQEPGPGIGQLPDGYLPIVDSGATAGLFDSAQAVATAVAAQWGAMSAPAAPTKAPAGTSPTGNGGAPGASDAAPAPAPARSGDGGTSDVVGQDSPVDEGEAAGAAGGSTTEIEAPAWSRAVLPTSVGLGAAGLIGAPLLRRRFTGGSL
ncbi:hypothetical protein [Cellulomonas hominis]